MRRRHVIIGIGPAGVAAAESIRALDDSADITIVSADRHGYYSRPGLAYLLTREMPQGQLSPFTDRDFEQLGARLVTAVVARVDTAAHRVVLAGGDQLPYDRLLLATGSRSSEPKVPGAELDGVVKLDDMDDALDMTERCREAKSAVVVGGGITALEIVEGLRSRKVQVHYFLRRDRFWSGVLSEAESELVTRGLSRDGVAVHRRTELARILGSQGRVVAAETGDGTQIPCQILAIAIGVRPQVELAREAGLECARGVLVDEHLRADDECIYAAGDVAEVREPGSGRGKLHVLWNTAVEKGRVAGHNMALSVLGCGQTPRVYETGDPLNITRLAGLRTTIIGTVGKGGDGDLQSLSRGDSQTWSELTDATVVETAGDEEHLRLTLDSGVIAGAVVMGDQTLSFPLQDLIERHVDISGIQAELETPKAPISKLVHETWHASGGQ